MKYRIVKIVNCKSCNPAGFNYGYAEPFLDINEAFRKLERVLQLNKYTCGCRAEVIEVKD